MPRCSGTSEKARRCGAVRAILCQREFSTVQYIGLRIHPSDPASRALKAAGGAVAAELVDGITPGLRVWPTRACSTHSSEWPVAPFASPLRPISHALGRAGACLFESWLRRSAANSADHAPSGQPGPGRRPAASRAEGDSAPGAAAARAHPILYRAAHLHLGPLAQDRQGHLLTPLVGAQDPAGVARRVHSAAVN